MRAKVALISKILYNIEMEFRERIVDLPAYLKARVREAIQAWMSRFGDRINRVLGRGSDLDAHFKSDLQTLKSTGSFPEVLYLGCGNDLSVQEVFDNVLHVDQQSPSVAFNRFKQTDACKLGLKNESVDLVVQRAMGYATESDPRSIAEMARVLKIGGKILRDFPSLDEEVHELHETLARIHYLLIERDYGNSGFVMERRLSPKNALFQRGTYDDAKVSSALEASRRAFFKILSEIPLVAFEQASESPFLKGRWAYHRALEFVLGFQLKSDVHSIQEQLGSLRHSLSYENMQKVTLMVDLLKKGMS